MTVRDEGDGVPIDQREVVFEAFRRLGDALTSTTRGTGLGLHIARQLIGAMNGRIWVDGTPGEGAVFHVTAPLSRPAVTVEPSPALPAPTLGDDRHELPVS